MKKKALWKKTVAAAVCAMLLCTGCGNSKTEESAQSKDEYYDAYEDATEAPMEAYYDDTEMTGLNGAADEVYDDAEYASEYEDGATQAAGSSEVISTGTDASSKVNREMLVYRGDLCVDTLDFDTSVSTFKSMIFEKGGFIESESYSDSYSTSGYYTVDADRKHNMYYATVRVPSSEYEAMMDAATTLGDVRSKSSNATNVTQQYSTYKSQLEIYEAEYARYLNLLEEATEDEYALMIEDQLFDIQMQIATLKSGISNIENDVAYSYIDITIKEVREYEEEPEPTDTFFDRFKHTCKQSWAGFLDFLEDALFFIIRNIYGIVVIVVIVLVMRTVFKKRKAKKLAAKSAMMNPMMQQANVPPMNQAQMGAQTVNQAQMGAQPVNQPQADVQPMQETPAQTSGQTDEK